MKKRIHFISWLMVAALSLPIFCFPQGGKKPLNIPYKFTEPHESTSLSKEASNQSTNQNWIVFSDREKNKTYTQSDLATPYKTIEFLDYFYVTEENDNAVHIYKDNDPGETLNPTAEDFGWIAKGNLMVWRRPLYNESNIQRKAMILNTEALIKQALERGQSSIVQFYNDPDLRIKNNRIANLYSIFYIYKLYPNAQNPKSALLGSYFVVNPGTVETVLWGWVNFTKLSPWDHRIAILPNTDENAINERKSHGIKSSVFVDEQAARLFRTGGNVDQDDILWFEDKYRAQNQYIGNFMRFPVLEGIAKITARQGDMKIGFIGDIAGQTGSVDPHTYAILQKQANELQMKSRNINIVFVIDGTTSMGPYYPKISEAIIKAMEKLDAEETFNHFKFGAVIYRDYAEGDRKTEVIPMTKDPNEIANSLKKINAHDFQDKDEPEAVFYGIKTAIQAMNLPLDQTNNLFLIGDAGNHKRNDETQVPIDDIIKLISKYNYNFFTFQVHNEGRSTFYEFVSQARQILQSVNQIQYTLAQQAANPLQQKIDPPAASLPINNKLRQYYLDKPYIFGAVNYCVPQYKVLPPDTLRSRIITSIKSINDSTNRMLEIVNCIINGGGSISSCLNKKSTESQNFVADAPFWKYLSKMNNIPPQTLEILKTEHYQIYAKGYVDQKKENYQYPLWQFELFYTKDELSDLLHQLEQLINSRTGADRREKFQQSWKTILKGHIEFKTEEVENLNIEQIEQMIFGLPGTSEFLKLKLKDIDDKAKLPDQDLMRWIYKIETNCAKIHKINDVAKGYEEYSFLSNEERYFWIPQNFLP